MNIFDYLAVDMDSYCLNHDFDEYDLYGERMEQESDCDTDIVME